MRFTRLRLENWKNFLKVDVAVERRVFLVGPNASGKSNLLDALRFLRDVAEPEGGFQPAVSRRNGVSQIRSLHARRYPNVTIDVEVELDSGERWRYRLEFSQDNQRRAMVQREVVWQGKRVVRERPDPEDEIDPNRLTQTHLQQVSANRDFRALAEGLGAVRYMHLVPQLVREPDRSVGRARDPFGGDFLEQLARTPKRTLESRFRKIQEALRVAVPQLKALELWRDPSNGVPHLRGLYEHWRPNAGWQNEEQFSDGTLRLLGLLWVFLDGRDPLLLEEPELSLHPGVVRHIPTIMARIGRKTGRQVVLSTHSADLLSEPGIAAEEVLVLVPTHEGTDVKVAADFDEVKALLEGGASVAEAVIPKTTPKHSEQLSLFGEQP